MPGKKDRERRRARERFERQREQRLQRQHKIRQRAGIGFAVLLVAGLVAGLTVAFTGGSGSAASGRPTATPSASASASATPSASASAAAVTEPAHHCTYTATGTAAKKVSLPPAAPDYTAGYTATINTNLGKINISLLNSKATCTVNSFVHLASAGFWDNSQCHRLSTSGGLYMLQCGDPYAKASAKLTCASTGSDVPGTGGPGYEFASENLTGATYKAGTVAMANSGGSATNGSQFFLVYKDTTLAPQYTPFGTITSGLDILQKVAKAGTSCTYPGAGGGAPKEKVVIDSVTIHKT